MPVKESDTDRRKRFARVLSSSRADADKTREYMAEGIGVSNRTIQNWENGVTAPDFFEGCEWFRVLGLNPIPYYLSFLFPDFFEGASPEGSDAETEQMLMLLIRNSTDIEKRELLYLMAGNHGSPWYSLLQMFTAHCHTTLKSRSSAASLILENYRMEAALGDIVCPDSVRPDVEILDKAIKQARKSVIKGLSGYTNAGVFEEE